MRKVFSAIEVFLEENNYVSPWIKSHSLDMEKILPVAEMQQLPKDTVIFRQQEYSPCCYVVVSGRVRVFFVDSGGIESGIFIAQEGCLIGELSAIDDGVSSEGAVAIVDTTLLAVKNSDMRRLMRQYPDLALAIMRGTAQKERVLISRLECYNKCSAKRVYISLLALCLEYGLATPQGIEIDLRFTHEELANLTGLNRVTVSKIYQKLKTAGIIDGQKGRLIICKPYTLMEMVEE